LLSDTFNREIDYLRVSVTDRCNLRCVYCMPQVPFVRKGRAQILSYEQIEAVVKAAVKLGIRKVRLTGGEPLLRKGIDRLVARLARIEGMEQLCMTTNGTLLAGLAASLKKNGLDRVNISIDSLDPDKYRKITGGGSLQEALAGVEAALEAGLTPVKVNMVILENTTEAEVEAMKGYCRSKGMQLQTVMRFSLYDRTDLSRRFRTDRPPPCASCNRLRLTADGFFKSCLFSDEELKIDFEDIAGCIRRAVLAKPANGTSCTKRSMRQIGG